MGVNFDSDTRRVIFLSPNYLGGSIISFNFDAIKNKNLDADFTVHITDAGLLNDIKVDNKTNVVIVSKSDGDGLLYLFFKEELLVDNKRKIAETDVLIDGITMANGIYVEGSYIYLCSTWDQSIYKINMYNTRYDIFSKLDDSFFFGGGWPDDIIRIDEDHFAISDNKNGGLYIVNNEGVLIKKYPLTYEGSTLVPANMVLHNGRLYFSHLWKADLFNIILTEITSNDYDFNDYSSGTYSIDVKELNLE